MFVLGGHQPPVGVDAALLRPSRFDRMVPVLPPDEEERAVIVRQYLVGSPAKSVDARWVVARTEGYSGADLAHLCETAAESAMEAAIATGTAHPMSTGDPASALGRDNLQRGQGSCVDLQAEQRPIRRAPGRGAAVPAPAPGDRAGPDTRPDRAEEQPPARPPAFGRRLLPVHPAKHSRRRRGVRVALVAGIVVLITVLIPIPRVH